MYTWGYIKEATLAKLDLDETEANEQNLLSKFHIYANEAMTQICSAVKPNYTFAEFIVTEENLCKMQTMPDDFISFGDDVNTVSYFDNIGVLINRECCDEDFRYVGYNKLCFFNEGIYHISYNAKWYKFSSMMDANVQLDVPDDILDCLPSYIASQCCKIDDQAKAADFRNEFEILVARIDNTNYKQTKTFTIGGDW